MKKGKVLLVCLVCILFAMPAFSNGNSEKSDTIVPADTGNGFSGTINMIASSIQADGLNAAMKEYQKANPKVSMDIINVQNVTDFETMMTSFIASNSLPDMYIAQVGATEQSYAANGYLLPLTDLGLSDRLVAGDRELLMYNGDLYAFPTVTAVSVVMLNNACLKKAGITMTSDNFPKDWTEFLALLDKLVAAGYKYPVGVAGKDTSSVTAWTFQYVYQSVYGQDPNWYANILRGKRAWNDELYLEMFNKYSQLLPYIAPSVLGTDNNQLNRDFVTGKSVVMFQTATTVRSLRQIDPDIDVICLPSCFTDNAKDQTLISGFDDGVSILSTTKQKDLCIDFLKFLTSDIGSTVYANATGFLPTTKDNNAKLDPSYSIILDVMQKGKLPSSPILSRQWISGIKEVMKTGQQNWLAGTDSKIVADTIQEQHLRLMKASPDWVKKFLADYKEK